MKKKNIVSDIRQICENAGYTITGMESHPPNKIVVSIKEVVNTKDVVWNKLAESADGLEANYMISPHDPIWGNQFAISKISFSWID